MKLSFRKEIGARQEIEIFTQVKLNVVYSHKSAIIVMHLTTCLTNVTIPQEAKQYVFDAVWTPICDRLKAFVNDDGAERREIKGEFIKVYIL